MTSWSRIGSRLRVAIDARLALLLLASMLVVIAISGPTAALQRDVFRYLFVLDVTQSMNVMDAGGTSVRRIDAARDAVMATLERLPCGSEAGLAIFTEYRSFVLFAPVEVCANFGVIRTVLKQIDWHMAWAARSEVAKGLYTALEAAKQLGQTTRVVFLTDGHEAPPLHPEIRPRMTEESGEIDGVIIGVGGSVPRPIPHLDERGQVLGYWAADEVLQVDRYSLGRSSTVGGEPMVGVDSSNLEERIAKGTEHLSSLREAYLERLARESGLHYYRLDGPLTLAEQLTRPMFADEHIAITDLRWIPAMLAILSLLVVYLGNVPRRRLLGAGRGRNADTASGVVG